MSNRQEFHAIKAEGRWRAYGMSLLTGSSFSVEFQEEFGTFWIEAGHHIREQIADDRVLVALLRHLLPPYQGGALDLFRGENRKRWELGRIGLAWTTNAETAKMFGSGPNAIRYGGVLLKARAQQTAIISGPNSHSRYLGEDQFTVDSFSLGALTSLEFFHAVD